MTAEALLATLRRLQDAGVVPAAAGALERGLPAVGPALRAAVLDEVPAFTASSNPVVLPELEQHARAHLAELVRLWRSGTPGNLDFVAEHARRRAEQRFPLEAMLHAYRCGHKVAALWMRDAAMAVRLPNVEAAIAAVADFAMEYTNAISTTVAAEYVGHTRLLAEAEGDRRSALLTTLIKGYDESDGRVAGLLRRAGYLDQRQNFCVALVQSTDPAEMESAERAVRISESVATAMRPLSARVLTGTHENAVIGIFSATRRLSGWTAPGEKLAARVSRALAILGPAVLVGVSSDKPSISYLPRAVGEAATALELAEVSHRVVRFDELPLRRLLLQRRGEQLRAARPAWFETLQAADRKAGGSLIASMRAYADADMNVQKAARIIQVHPNTLYARLERINALTSLDCRRFHDLTELLLAADCH